MFYLFFCVNQVQYHFGDKLEGSFFEESKPTSLLGENSNKEESKSVMIVTVCVCEIERKSVRESEME